ncbi:MAG: hypothetical protein Q7T81_00575 [Pseudolabrys sp.]|nr:hypothetical protein [Pseudolabrys sp.]
MSALLALFLVFGAVQPAPAGSYQGDGTYTGTPSPVVTALFAAFPNGGDGLMAALRDLIIRNPALADDVAYVGSRSNAAQQAAAGAGMAQAYTALINRGDSNAASRVVSAAQQSASSPIQSAMTRAVGVTIGSNSYQQGGTAKTPCTPAGTVSPTC